MKKCILIITVVLVLVLSGCRSVVKMSDIEVEMMEVCETDCITNETELRDQVSDLLADFKQSLEDANFSTNDCTDEEVILRSCLEDTEEKRKGYFQSYTLEIISNVHNNSEYIDGTLTASITNVFDTDLFPDAHVVVQVITMKTDGDVFNFQLASTANAESKFTININKDGSIFEIIDEYQRDTSQSYKYLYYEKHNHYGYELYIKDGAVYRHSFLFTNGDVFFYEDISSENNEYRKMIRFEDEFYYDQDDGNYKRLSYQYGSKFVSVYYTEDEQYSNLNVSIPALLMTGWDSYNKETETFYLDGKALDLVEDLGFPEELPYVFLSVDLNGVTCNFHVESIEDVEKMYLLNDVFTYDGKGVIPDLESDFNSSRENYNDVYKELSKDYDFDVDIDFIKAIFDIE